MTAYCLLIGWPKIGWYSGIVVLDVVRGERVLYQLMFNIMHVQTFVEECKSEITRVHNPLTTEKYWYKEQ
jgi:hypothetical protein